MPEFERVRWDPAQRHRDHRFRAPVDLQPRDPDRLNVLVVGSCLSAGLTHFLELAGHAYEYVPFNFLHGYPEKSSEELERVDCMLVQLMLRSVWSEHVSMRLDWTDEAGWTQLFEAACTALEQYLDAALVYHAQAGVLTFVCNFLVPQQNPMGRLLPRYDLRNPVYFVEELNRRLDALVRDRLGVHVLDVDGVSATFGRMYQQDDSVWVTAHGSYFADYDVTQDAHRIAPPKPLSEVYAFRPSEFLHGVVAELEAAYRSVRQHDQVKLVVFDLDDTLWRGVPAETGEWAGSAEGWPIGLAEAATFLKRRGVLLALLSKNDAARVAELWDTHFLGRLTLDDFAVRRIGWAPKPEGMAEILEATNLLPRSVVFVDDNPVERAAMAEAYPDMRILGEEPLWLRRILLWSPETQVAQITAESSARTGMIQAAGERGEAARKLSRADFLATLELVVTPRVVADPLDPAFGRAAELLNKTNQFNTTGRRWSPADLAALFARGGVLHTFEVADRFSRYGLVGVIVVDGPTLEQMVMSCRVVGLDVEIAMVAEVLRAIAVTGADEAAALAVETDANLLSRDLWTRTGFTPREDGSWARALAPPLEPPPHVRVAA